MNNSFIQINNISKHFADVKAVDDVSFEIKEGEFFSLLGPSGCGKTTLLRLLAGFEYPTSGNLLIDSQTYITEFRGGGSTDGQIQLNCSSNSHGQKIVAQPHSEAVTNEMLLPKGANSTLVSEIATQTLTNKTIGVGQLTGNTRAYTGDGSTVAFTVTSGMTVQNTLVFLNGVFQRPTTDYTVSGTTLTFGSAPIAADVITIKEL